jgi:transcriptional regulator with XRE-family HTH domain
MIRIDGSRVKQLREERGLTQLYLATTVEVTTDTISRWENRHYPTIKRENGLRLAEALEVELEEILEKPAETDEPATVIEEPAESQPLTRAGVPVKKYNLLLNIGLAVMIPVVIGLVIWNKKNNVEIFEPAAIRSLPLTCAPGLKFPVLLSVQSKQEMPLLIRETVPGGVKIIKTMPDTAVQNKNILKWIRKKGGEQLVAGYLARAEGLAGTSITFSGNVAVRQGKKQEATITGDVSLKLEPVHWADINGDFIISDDEVLEVYDKFGKLPGLEQELEQVEEIWMGSGYSWDTQTKTITIHP